MTMNIRLDHPECLDGYCWIDDVTLGEFDDIFWSTKKLGKIPHDAGSDDSQNLHPLFVQIEELESSNVGDLVDLSLAIV